MNIKRFRLRIWFLCFAASFCLAATPLFAQQAEDSKPAPVESPEPAKKEGEAETKPEGPVRGGVTYDPVKDANGDARDPFKSPFEIEREEQEKAKAEAAKGLSDLASRLPFNISELSLKGIYLDARSGYWAIFTIGDEYDWFQVGTKFRDGDLVNIADGAVVFRHYISEDSTQVREVIKELHRGEE